MKKLIVAIVLSAVLVVGFIAGVVAQAPALLIISFCAWTPAAWFTGYAVARAGIHLSLSLEDKPASSGKRPVRRLPEFQ